MNEEKTKPMRLVDEFAKNWPLGSEFRSPMCYTFANDIQKYRRSTGGDFDVDTCNFGGWLMEQLNESRKQVVKLRAERVEMLEVFKEFAYRCSCDDGIRYRGTFTGAKLGLPCQRCAWARDLIAKVEGKTGEPE